MLLGRAIVGKYETSLALKEPELIATARLISSGYLSITLRVVLEHEIQCQNPRGKRIPSRWGTREEAVHVVSICH